MEQKKDDYNEMYKGITRVIKTKQRSEDAWFAVIGNMIVSRGTFKTKEECIKDLETPDYEQICKVALAISTALKKV